MKRILSQYVTSALIVACLALSGVSVWLWVGRVRADALAATLAIDVARFERNEIALKDQLKANARAMLASAEHIAVQNARKAQLSATIERIKDIPDALLDPALADLINGLHRSED